MLFFPGLSLFFPTTSPSMSFQTFVFHLLLCLAIKCIQIFLLRQLQQLPHLSSSLKPSSQSSLAPGLLDGVLLNRKKPTKLGYMLLFLRTSMSLASHFSTLDSFFSIKIDVINTYSPGLQLGLHETQRGQMCKASKPQQAFKKKCQQSSQALVANAKFDINNGTDVIYLHQIKKNSQKHLSALARMIVFSYFSQVYQIPDSAFSALSKYSTKALPTTWIQNPKKSCMKRLMKHFLASLKDI